VAGFDLWSLADRPLGGLIDVFFPRAGDGGTRSAGGPGCGVGRSAVVNRPTRSSWGRGFCFSRFETGYWPTALDRTGRRPITQVSARALSDLSAAREVSQPKKTTSRPHRGGAWPAIGGPGTQKGGGGSIPVGTRT